MSPSRPLEYKKSWSCGGSHVPLQSYCFAPDGAQSRPMSEDIATLLLSSKRDEGKEEQQEQQQQQQEGVRAGRKRRETKGCVQAPAASRRCATATASSAAVGSLHLPWKQA